jgi:hypothetical protein
MPATPLFVIKALAEVDASGLAENMLDRDSVEMLVTDQRAAEWLNSVSDGQYEDALEDMVAAGSDDWMRQDTLDSGDEDDDPDVTALPDDRNLGW